MQPIYSVHVVMMSFYSRIFYFLLSSLVINVVTTPLDVTDVTVWPITSNPNPRVLKIENRKINQKKNEMKKENKKQLSSRSLILTILVSSCHNNTCLQYKNHHQILYNISSCLYILHILKTKQGIAALSKFLKRLNIFIKNETSLPSEFYPLSKTSYLLNMIRGF